jgi:hypothetical protein
MIISIATNIESCVSACSTAGCCWNRCNQGARLATRTSVSVYTVAKELGHGGESMVRRVYRHLGQVRHRADAVEYRLEQHVAKLGGRLEALRSVGFVTTCVTTGLDSQPDRVSAVAATPRA